MALYEIAILGSPTEDQIRQLEQCLTEAAQAFKFKVPEEIVMHIQPAHFKPGKRVAAATLFFGAVDLTTQDIDAIIDLQNIPVLPIASTALAVPNEIPAGLRMLNCLFLDTSSIERIFSAMLECLNLLPTQRRIFLSYRRSEATTAAVQLFAELSSRQYEVFIDSYAITPAVKFQEALWHQLCHVDVLLMLETPGYFESRWPSAEYGRALAKGIGVLGVQWPETQSSARSSNAKRIRISASEIDDNGKLSERAIEQICDQLEAVRSVSHATRQLGMISAVQQALELVEGEVVGIGANRLIHSTLRSGRQLLLQPVLGVPTALDLQTTLERAGSSECAMVYDHLGLKASWQEHLEWLSQKIDGTKWVKKTDAAWDLGGWEAQ